MQAIGTMLLVSTVLLPASAAAELLIPQASSTLATSTGTKFYLAAAAAKKRSAPAAQPRGAYLTMPLAERVGIQFDLAWTGDYSGLIDGDINDKSIAAVKAFQQRHGLKETGVLAPTERSALAEASKQKQQQVGWRMLDDRITGVQVWVPTKLAPNSSRGRSGTRWSSAQGQIQIETFRTREPGTTLASTFEQQKKEPASRKVELSLLRPDFFILSGVQGLKKFYVRAAIRDDEVRGLTILYDQATEGLMDAVTVAMSSMFAPFTGSGIAALIGPPVRRKVEYATGIVVSSAGHVLTDRHAMEGCNIIELSGYGGADRIADDAAIGVALLRIYGAVRLAPATLVRPEGKSPELTLVGISDPQAQDGGQAISSMAARSKGGPLHPVPPPGFAGAAALDDQERLVGMVHLTEAALANAGAGAGSPQASVVGTQALTNFLEAQSVAPASGPAGIDALKAALVRVICIRG
jgi:peptidoglycan hydrolase-like protein with peptidoglycan-binding domain